MDPVSQQLVLLNFFINDLDDESQGTLAVPSSVVTPNWEQWMSQQRIVLLCTGTSTSWRSGLVGTSKTQQREGKVLHLRRNSPRQQDMLGWPERNKRGRKGPGGSGGHQVEHEPGKSPGGKEGE